VDVLGPLVFHGIVVDVSVRAHSDDSLGGRHFEFAATLTNPAHTTEATIGARALYLKLAREKI
jgi:hypothetical protein